MGSIMHVARLTVYWNQEPLLLHIISTSLAQPDCNFEGGVWPTWYMYIHSPVTTTQFGLIHCSSWPSNCMHSTSMFDVHSSVHILVHSAFDGPQSSFYSTPYCGGTCPGLAEKFQSEIGKHISRSNKYHCSLIGLHLPSIKARVLLKKFTFLTKLLESKGDHINIRVYSQCLRYYM